MRTVHIPSLGDDSSILNVLDTNSILVYFCDPARMFFGGIQLDLGLCLAKPILFQHPIFCIRAPHLHTSSVEVFGISLVFGLAESTGLVFPIEHVHVWTLLCFVDGCTKVWR